MSSEEILKIYQEFIDADEALSAAVTKSGVLLSKEDVITLMGRAVSREQGEVFKFINPALHLLHNNQSVNPKSKEHNLLEDLHRRCD